VSLRFVLTLHSHLPWVLHHGRWPHGSDWLCEAALDSYLPLIGMLDTLARDGMHPPITLGLTPILVAQFAHPSFREELDAYFAHRLETIAEAPESLEATHDTDLLPVVPFWRDHVTALRDIWLGTGKDLISAFRRHVEQGRLELISSAATHGFLPLLARDESIRFQLLVGRAEHARHFGDLPIGCWIPECAYRPAGEWQPLPGVVAPRHRVGIEELVRYSGFRWFFIDAHIIDAGEVQNPYGDGVRTVDAAAARRSPYQAYKVGNARHHRQVHVLVRDPASTAQVWSRFGGYPGDGRYLEFHKIRYPGGLKFWRVTSNTTDLGAKERYAPGDARDAVHQHAMHFRSMLDATASTAAPEDHAIAAPFDTELFGHWWFEGMDFLQQVYRDIDADSELLPTSGSASIAASPPDVALTLRAGSWGRDGDFSMWLNPETEWTWKMLWPLEERFWNAVPAAIARDEIHPILEQAARELLLAQGSDWQFIITTGAAGDYATKRFVEHCDALAELLPHLERRDTDIETGLDRARALQELDGPFPDLIGALAAASDVTPT
jgi:1,4-alpha-glucan branching enzyme